MTKPESDAMKGLGPTSPLPGQPAQRREQADGTVSAPVTQKTPTPWHVVPHPDPLCSILSINAASTDHFADGFVTVWDTFGNAQSIARLMAAAPDLLAALQKFVARASERGPITFSDDRGGCLQVARAAIAKATAQGDAR